MMEINAVFGVIARLIMSGLMQPYALGSMYVMSAAPLFFNELQHCMIDLCSVALVIMCGFLPVRPYASAIDLRIKQLDSLAPLVNMAVYLLSVTPQCLSIYLRAFPIISFDFLAKIESDDGLALLSNHAIMAFFASLHSSVVPLLSKYITLVLHGVTQVVFLAILFSCCFEGGFEGGLARGFEGLARGLARGFEGGIGYAGYII
jgi:hypothetical protein